MKKQILFIFLILLALGNVFAGKKLAVWFIDDNPFDKDPGISLYTADKVTIENGFVKLEGDIKYYKRGRDADIDRVLEESQEYGPKAKKIGEGTLYINSNRIFAIKDFEE